jgi:hypothetical protein
MRSFSALEHRFLQDMHLYRAAAFHKKNRHATQGRVAKRCLQPEKSTTIFNNIYNTNRHPLSNEERIKAARTKAVIAATASLACEQVAPLCIDRMTDWVGHPHPKRKPVRAYLLMVCAYSE